MSPSLTTATASTLVILTLFAGCGSPASTAAANAATNANASPDGLDRCALLKDDEVTAAIGAHGEGTSDFNNEWGLQSCRWVATTDQHVEGYPDGWFEQIEVTVFFKDKESWARGEAKGDAVQGLTSHATYDSTYGQLWFDCPGSRFCAVKARTASGEHREQIARQFAQLVATRLH
jgi:hypothetical protein